MGRNYGRLLFPRDFKGNPFGKYDKVIDRVLEDIGAPAPKTKSRTSGKGPSRRNFGPMARKPSRFTAVPRRGKKTYKRKRTSTKRTVRKSSKKRKVSKKSKYVSLTVGTARESTVEHSNRSVNHAHYNAFSATGSKSKMLMMPAQAMLLHYMHRVGDYRANKTMTPTGQQHGEADADEQLTTWSKMKIDFLGLGASADSTNQHQETIDNTVPKTLAVLTGELRDILSNQFQFGRRISQVSMFRATECILFDISAGRNIIEFSSHATMKLQNTTLADSVHAQADPASVLNVHRNPISGYAYKFKNQVPLFKMQYLVSKPAATRLVLDELSAETTELSGVNYVDFAANGDEWNSPPVAPTTIFRNGAGKSPTSISPGGHRTYTLKEYFRGPINSFADRYIRQRWSGGQPDATMPPGSSCMLVGFKPTYRTSDTEDIKIEKEIKYTYCSRMTKAKLTPLPMNTILD